MEIFAFKGGGVWRLMANAILNFDIFLYFFLIFPLDGLSLDALSESRKCHNLFGSCENKASY